MIRSILDVCPIKEMCDILRELAVAPMFSCKLAFFISQSYDLSNQELRPCLFESSSCLQVQSCWGRIRALLRGIVIVHLTPW
jgi:hypothetical protein